MIDKGLFYFRNHHNNINCYRRLLKTRLTELERQYIEERLREELSALEEHVVSTTSIAFA